ncbi:LysR family transcriptional regulator [Acinetobacter sp. B10A]|nr:LysR family transcriptional regulator [Acinetobacter baretiae]
MDRMDCDRMFIAIIETGNFTLASKRLGTSLGQASKLIAKLEADLAVTLLRRTTRSITATEMGTAYYERIKPLLSEYEAINDDMRLTTQTPRGLLKISVPVTFGASQLTDPLLQFAQKYPDIELDIQFSDRIVNIVDEGFDLAIRIGHLTSSSLIARKLCPVRTLVVASDDYLSKNKTPESWKDLAQHNCILDTNFIEPYLWTFSDKQGKMQIQPVTGKLKFSNAEACLKAVCAGFGIAKLPDFVVKNAIDEGKLKTILEDYEAPPRGLYVIYPPTKYLAHKSRVMIDFLVHTFSH